MTFRKDTYLHVCHVIMMVQKVKSRTETEAIDWETSIQHEYTIEI